MYSAKYQGETQDYDSDETSDASYDFDDESSNYVHLFYFSRNIPFCDGRFSFYGRKLSGKFKKTITIGETFLFTFKKNMK